MIQFTNNMDETLHCACANCDWGGTIAELHPIKDPQYRIHAGEICPAGECPECGALANLEEFEGESENELTIALLDRLRTEHKTDSIETIILELTSDTTAAPG